MKGLAYRIVLTVINIFFPPLAVMMLTGAGYDTMLNCFLFLLAVIPSHIHGFYISCTYFHRRHKVKKGRYPGGPKSFIQSSNVINGGASNAEVERLYRQEKGMKRSNSSRRSRSRGPSPGSPQMVQRQGSNVHRQNSRLGRQASNRSNGYGPDPRVQRWASQVAQDGYGQPQSPQRATGYAPMSPASERRGRW